MLSTKQVAEQIGVSPAHVRVVLGRHPELAPKKIGRSWVWSKRDVEKLRRYIDRKNEGGEQQQDSEQQ